MPFAAEVFARHVGMDRRGSSFVSESFFSRVFVEIQPRAH